MEVIYYPHCQAPLPNTSGTSGQVVTCGGCRQEFNMPLLTGKPVTRNCADGVVSLVLGILSFFTFGVTGIIGLFVAARGLKTHKRGLAVAGLVTSINLCHGILNLEPVKLIEPASD